MYYVLYQEWVASIIVISIPGACKSEKDLQVITIIVIATYLDAGTSLES
jgi:hypothetical protein